MCSLRDRVMTPSMEEEETIDLRGRGRRLWFKGELMNELTRDGVVIFHPPSDRLWNHTSRQCQPVYFWKELTEEGRHSEWKQHPLAGWDPGLAGRQKQTQHQPASSFVSRVPWGCGSPAIPQTSSSFSWASPLVYRILSWEQPYSYVWTRLPRQVTHSITFLCRVDRYVND